MKSFSYTGITNIRSADHRVDKIDIKEAKASADSKEIPSERVFIDKTQQQFYVDETPVTDPMREYGSLLKIKCWDDS